MHNSIQSVLTPMGQGEFRPETPDPASSPLQQGTGATTGVGAADGIPAKGKKIALARFNLLRAWKAACPKGSKTKATEDFLSAYNAGFTFPALLETLGQITRGTLYRWDEMLDDKSDWTALVPAWFLNGSAGQRLSPIEEEVFLQLLLSPNKNRIGTATRLTQHILKTRGVESTKSPMTFRRFAEEYKKQHFDTYILMREGEKALKDKVSPYIQRDPSLLEVGDALVADGHRLNFRVINPFTGKPCRATIVAYVDWKSFDLAGYEIMVEENTQCIAAALRNSILWLGKINRVAYQDNGKAFKGRFFTGSPSLEETGLSGLFSRLGIIPVFARPYNARAKIIERWFREFSDTFERLLPSYIGASIEDKPAYMMRNEKFHKAIHNEYVPTIEETCQLIDMWLQFHRNQECPHVKGKGIGEVSAAGKGPGVNEADLDDLLMETKITDIRRNGITFLKQNYYDDNLYGLRETVVIKYSLFNLSSIKVYTLGGEFICRAGRVMSVHPLAAHLGMPKDVTDLKSEISRQRRLERQTVQGAKELIAGGRRAELDWQRVVEAAPAIVGKLERENVSLPALEEHIPDECMTVGAGPCACPVLPDTTNENGTHTEEGNHGGIAPTTADVVRLEPQTRPIFETPTARYEWHLEFGMFTDEDRAWCAWFQTTDDFKMLYTYFEQQM